MLGKFVGFPVDTGYPTNPSQSSRPTAITQHAPHSNQGNEDIIARSAVSLEYMSLRNTAHCPLGIYVVPTVNDLLVWDAVFFVHQGYYADSILKFRLRFPRNYPDSPPSVDFLTDVFHPLISTSGSFNLAARFKPWRPKEHHVFDILHYIKVAFKKHALDDFQESDCFNKEAFRYRESTQSFAALAIQSASLSHSESALFDMDHPSPMGFINSEIEFRKLDPDQLNLQRTKLGLDEWEKNIAKD